MLFPWVLTTPKASPNETKMQFLDRLTNVLESGLRVEDVIRDIPIDILKVHKFDEYIPDELIRTRAGQEWLDWEQAKLDLQKIILTSKMDKQNVTA